MKKQWIAIFLYMSLLATGLLRLTGCAAKVQADDLMKGITPEKTSGRAADDARMPVRAMSATDRRRAAGHWREAQR